MLSLQKFLRGTNDGRFIALGTTNRLDPVTQGGIGDMRAIPCDQVIHTMDRGHSDMQGVYLGIWGQWYMREQGLSQMLDSVGDVQLGEVCQHGQASCGSLWITGAGFLNNKLRDVEIKIPTMVMPPIVRHLLVGCRDQITAWPCSEVAGNRGFKISLGLHKQKAN
jgi:hypothetical protein